jgi:hypothetical protein
MRGLLTQIHPALEQAFGDNVSHKAVVDLLSRCGGPARHHLTKPMGTPPARSAVGALSGRRLLAARTSALGPPPRQVVG